MRTTNQTRIVGTMTAVLAGLTGFATLSQGALILEEQFDYESGLMDGHDGGIGFDGPWVASKSHGRDYQLGTLAFSNGAGSTIDDAGGLTFTDDNGVELPTAGSALSRFGSAGRAESHRRLTTESKNALLGDGTTMWFSALFSAPSAHRWGSFLFGTDEFTTAGSPELPVDGEGFGFTLMGEGFGQGDGTINALAFDDATTPIVSAGSFTQPIEAGATHHDTSLIVGKINWKANGTPDELFLFNVTDLSTEPAEEDAIASITNLDLDQSAFDTVTVWDTNSAIHDEFRFGNTFGDVTGGFAMSTLFPIIVTQDGADLNLSWSSQPGMLYNLRTSTDLAADFSTWDLVDVEVEGSAVTDIPAAPPLNAHNIPLPADPTRFYRVEEFPAPPVTVFSDDLESGQGDWTTGSDGAAGTEWELGSPGTGPTAANSGANVFGTDLDANYANGSNVWLRTPAIDLTSATGATLTFAEFKDIEPTFDSGTITVLDGSDDSTIAEIASEIDGVSTAWESASFSLPAEALGKTIKIEFRLVSDDFGDFPGWYIDDVAVTTPAP